MKLAELLDRCRGEMSKAAFARELGLSLRMLQYLYAGEREPGGYTLRRLAQDWPEEVAAYLAGSGVVADGPRRGKGTRALEIQSP